jgi:hypothetical protein
LFFSSSFLPYRDLGWDHEQTTLQPPRSNGKTRGS